MELPKFRYQPDPFATGSVEERAITCASCGQPREFVYVGPVYAEAELDDAICPWCIADGSAHEKFGAEFNDLAGVGDYGAGDPVSDDVKAEVAYRTPGFNGWQQERWLTHCGDSCAFLGPAGKAEIEAFGSDELVESIRLEAQMNEEQFRDYFDQVSKRDSPTAYIFRCLHCGRYLGYSDCD